MLKCRKISGSTTAVARLLSLISEGSTVRPTQRMRGSQGAGRHRARLESSTGHPGHNPRQRCALALRAATGTEPTCRPSAARAAVAAACPTGHFRRGKRAQVATAPFPPAMCMELLVAPGLPGNRLQASL